VVKNNNLKSIFKIKSNKFAGVFERNKKFVQDEKLA